IVSSLVFVVYYVSLFAGEELADKMIISPFIGMWISNIIFTIAGVYLVIYSMRERKIIHIEKIKDFFKRKQNKESSYENN
ncbi:MAG: LptF/LptG family permease, partial [Candidatus Cloacimonetes bacterium]|nr:LptF/LptG family permease [Candidatus Cloacimonadota bacterium]